MTEETLIEFPCRFPIKVVGLNTPDFEVEIIGLVRQKAQDMKEDAIRSRLSKDGKYMALTIVVNAQSQEQLDDIYRLLTANERVLMAL